MYETRTRAEHVRVQNMGSKGPGGPGSWTGISVSGTGSRRAGLGFRDLGLGFEILDWDPGNRIGVRGLGLGFGDLDWPHWGPGSSLAPIPLGHVPLGSPGPEKTLPE